jgi:hypothetical protein
MSRPTHHHDGYSHAARIVNESAPYDPHRPDAQGAVQGPCYSEMQRGTHDPAQSRVQTTIQDHSRHGTKLEGRVPYHARVQHHRDYTGIQTQQGIQQTGQSPVQTALSFAEGLARLNEATGTTLLFYAK